MAIEEIYRTFVDRFKNPYLGSFLISFGFLNWKVFILYFAGEISPFERIVSLELYFQDIYFFKTLVFSSLLMIFYVIGVPLIISLLNWFKAFLDVLLIRLDAIREQKIRSEREVAGQYEKVAASLKQSLKECHAQFTNFNKLIESNISNFAPGLLKTSVEKEVQKNKHVIQLIKMDLSHVEDIMTVNVMNHGQILQSYFDKRQKRK